MTEGKVTIVKIDKLELNFKISAHLKTLLRKGNPHSGRRYLQNTYPPQAQYYLSIFDCIVWLLEGGNEDKNLEKSNSRKE